MPMISFFGIFGLFGRFLLFHFQRTFGALVGAAHEMRKDFGLLQQIFEPFDAAIVGDGHGGRLRGRVRGRGRGGVRVARTIHDSKPEKIKI